MDSLSINHEETNFWRGNTIKDNNFQNYISSSFTGIWSSEVGNIWYRIHSKELNKTLS